ncbi:flagellar motor protein MotD [Marinimicrobium sp. C6131]|uniref:flagellar motor protein MotD n=1 Tax=Marinimicrobium sp. C6131 TaxID=3022676 RepID=UPI00223DAAF3|nr:flagellar motor protein MotD [Marinimicrobium sp. C6131]UZJ45248.1 flagellar motor protein MotD [Marinimicrobium sp. C6131]
MPRRRPTELHVNHERWLVSYADFITLLFAFFVVMYSISQVNESKYRVLSDTLMEAFEPARTNRPIQVGEPSRSPSASAIDIRGDDRGDTEQPRLGESGGLAGEEGLGELGELAERISERFSDLIGDDLLEVYANEYWLQVELRDSILFESGSAELSGQARDIFAEMARLLAEYDNPIQVEGHTDNQPIRNLRYPSNWELSAARASAIVKLLSGAGVSAQRLSAVGYGEHQPSAANDTPQGRAQNRRVALMIAREAIQRPSAALDENGAGDGFLPPREAAPESAPQESGPEADSSSGDSAESAAPVEPVQLEGGGLLFSSDPDLPRQR